MTEVLVINPAKNPKKKTAKKRKQTTASRSAAAKKGWATRRRKTTARKASAKKGAKKRKTTKTVSAKRSAAAKKGWRKRKGTKTRRTTTVTRTTTNKSRKRSAAAKKGWRNRKRGGTTRRNPRKFPKSMKQVQAYFPTMKGKVTGADVAGGVMGGFVGTGLSGLTKMATDNDAAGVIVHGVSWIGGTLIAKNFPGKGKAATKNSFARGWFIVDGIAFGMDAALTIFRYVTREPSISVSLSDIEAAPWADKIKMVFLKGLGNPEEYIQPGAFSFSPGLGNLDLTQQEDIDSLLDYYESQPDLTDQEADILAEIKQMQGYTTTTRDAAAQELI